MSSVLPSPHLHFKVEDNIFQFSVRMVDAEFKNDVVSCYIIYTPYFSFIFIFIVNLPFLIYNNC
jgi:hypothetical protein